MSTKFKSRDRDGFHWLVAIVGDKIYWLYRMARLGDRHRVDGGSRLWEKTDV